MDVLIKNMELPKKCDMLMVAIFSDGSVDFKGRGEIKTHRTKAIELPPHGQLIDRDAVLKKYNHVGYMWQESPNTAHEEFVHIVYNAPVVLEAST